MVINCFQVLVIKFNFNFIETKVLMVEFFVILWFTGIKNIIGSNINYHQKLHTGSPLNPRGTKYIPVIFFRENKNTNLESSLLWALLMWDEMSPTMSLLSAQFARHFLHCEFSASKCHISEFAQNVLQKLFHCEFFSSKCPISEENFSRFWRL